MERGLNVALLESQLQFVGDQARWTFSDQLQLNLPNATPNKQTDNRKISSSCCHTRSVDNSQRHQSMEYSNQSGARLSTRLLTIAGLMCLVGGLFEAYSHIVWYLDYIRLPNRDLFSRTHYASYWCGTLVGNSCKMFTTLVVTGNFN
jgi:hypothetical protein